MSDRSLRGMRLGAQSADLLAGSVVAEAYGASTAVERHRHRYEVNNEYRDRLTAAGLVVSGTHHEWGLVEFVELPREVHPYYVATQAHPELKSRPTRPHPLFRSFIEAALKYKAAERLPVDLGDDYESNDAPADAVAAVNAVTVEPVAGLGEAVLDDPAGRD